MKFRLGYGARKQNSFINHERRPGEAHDFFREDEILALLEQSGGVSEIGVISISSG
jgi:hypothetical protein